MLNFITQHPVISVVAFIVATDFVYSTIRLLLVFVCSFIPSKENDFKRNIRAQLDRLESRIAKIETVRSEET